MDGILVVNKDKNCTSRDLVNTICKIFNTKKVGHTGTLDPLATGVLIVCIGKYTKLNEFLASKDKEYIATFKLGIKTNTYDITGDIIETSNASVSYKIIKDVIDSFPKSYDQEVPIFSAVKINGKKLYEYARKNQKIELPKRKVTIKKLELLDYNNDLVTIKTTVSKGTYIRSLINDIGIKLNTFATMTALVRTKQGVFDIKNSYTINEIKQGNHTFLSLEEIFKDYEIRSVDDILFEQIKHGSLLPYDFYQYVLFKYHNKNVAIYKQYDKNKKLAKPYIMLI